MPDERVPDGLDDVSEQSVSLRGGFELGPQQLRGVWKLVSAVLGRQRIANAMIEANKYVY